MAGRWQVAEEEVPLFGEKMMRCLFQAAKLCGPGECETTRLTVVRSSNAGDKTVVTVVTASKAKSHFALTTGEKGMRRMLVIA
jgi:hypothetical protein